MLPFFTNIGAYLKTSVNAFNVAATTAVSGSAIQLEGPGYGYKSAEVVLYLGAATGTAGSASVVAQVQQSADGSTSWTSYTDPQGNGALTVDQGAAFTATNGTSAATYNATTGILTLTISGAPFGTAPAIVGVPAVITNITGTGAGCPSLNGTFLITSVGTSGTVINVQAPTGLVASGLSNGTMTEVAVGVQATMNVILQGAQQYVRVVATPTLAGSVTAIPLVVAIALGGSSDNPAI